MKKIRKATIKGSEDFRRLLRDEHMCKIPTFKKRLIRDKYNAGVERKKQQELKKKKEIQRAANKSNHIN